MQDAPNESLGSSSGQRQQAKILVVDDDERLLAVLRRGLSLRGFDAGLARDSGQALGYLQANWPDIIVLDIMMPGMDGLSLCRLIRENSTLPILMLTARDSVPDRVAGLTRPPKSARGDVVARHAGSAQGAAARRGGRHRRPQTPGGSPPQARTPLATVQQGVGEPLCVRHRERQEDQLGTTRCWRTVGLLLVALAGLGGGDARLPAGQHEVSHLDVHARGQLAVLDVADGMKAWTAATSCTVAEAVTHNTILISLATGRAHSQRPCPPPGGKHAWRDVPEGSWASGS